MVTAIAERQSATWCPDFVLLLIANIVRVLQALSFGPNWTNLSDYRNHWTQAHQNGLFHEPNGPLTLDFNARLIDNFIYFQYLHMYIYLIFSVLIRYLIVVKCPQLAHISSYLILVSINSVTCLINT